VPDYIKRLTTHNRAKEHAKGGTGLFDKSDDTIPAIEGEIIPDVKIREAEYHQNPLAGDVKYWGHWVLAQAQRDIGALYSLSNPRTISLAYLWARTIQCPNPTCKATITLFRQLWLCSKAKRPCALRLVLDRKKNVCSFVVTQGADIDFDPDQQTVAQGDATCPFCHQTASSEYLRSECQAGRMGQQMMAVVFGDPAGKTKTYRNVDVADVEQFQESTRALDAILKEAGRNIAPDEPISKQQPRVMWVTNYGLTKWSDLFNSRQLLATITLARHISRIGDHFRHDPEYGKAVATIVACAADKCLDFSTTLCRWGNDDEGVAGTFGRQALPMVWDYAESNPFQDRTGGFSWALEFAIDAVSHVSLSSTHQAVVQQGTATRLPYEDHSLVAVITDPPYYDAVPYADLSDFFYVWLKRRVGRLYPDLLRTQVTPKAQELIEERPHSSLKQRKDKTFYEVGMLQAFREAFRCLHDDGVCCVMFAHKTTSAWETIVTSLTKAGLVVTSSWPIHTEMRTRMMALGTAALASSVSLVCRKRLARSGDGLWDDVRKELQGVAKERLDFFWSQGIRGADFFISAIGPALSVFGKYERVTKLSGEEVTVGQFLDEVRSLVTSYALAKILKTTHTANIDPESRFYVVWKWSYGAAKVPADEAFKLAQALGMSTEIMWDRTGVLEKSGENVQAMPVAKRMKIKGLGEPDSTSAPASLIDVLHRMCVFRENGETVGMTEFLTRSGQAQNPALWLVAQAVSEILPDGDKEKQLMQGLLNQKEQLAEAQGRLF
jgi:adenine-specific DNA methylase